MAHKKT